MKTLYIVCLIALYNSCNAQSKDETAIRNAMNEQLSAWNSGNIDAFIQTYWSNDSLLFVNSPPTYGWQATFDRYKKAYPNTEVMGKLSLNCCS